MPYRKRSEPNEPMLLHMEHLPLTPNRGLSNVEQFRLGREQLLNTPFIRSSFCTEAQIIIDSRCGEAHSMRVGT